MARRLRRTSYKVTVLPLARNLLAFQRRLRRLAPDVVFNQYDDVVHGALYEMRLPALVRMMGFPITGSPALAVGLTRYKYMSASLLQGAGIRIPFCTEVLERLSDVDRRVWSFPLIVQPSQEHAGMGLDRDSIVHSKKAPARQDAGHSAGLPSAGAGAVVPARPRVQRGHFVDPKSFVYLHGMTLDYEATLIRQGFNFINPNSTKSCGCGSSFSV